MSLLEKFNLEEPPHFWGDEESTENDAQEIENFANLLDGIYRSERETKKMKLKPATMLQISNFSKQEINKIHQNKKKN